MHVPNVLSLAHFPYIYTDIRSLSLSIFPPFPHLTSSYSLSLSYSYYIYGQRLSHPEKVAFIPPLSLCSARTRESHQNHQQSLSHSKSAEQNATLIIVNVYVQCAVSSFCCHSNQPTDCSTD